MDPGAMKGWGFMSRAVRSMIAGAAASASLLAVGVSSALAAGGSSIAGATPIVVGQQEFGNTATDGGFPCNAPYDPYNGGSWWSLSVAAGDKITLDYEGDLGGVLIYPIGTTDFNVTSANADNSHVGSNDKQEYTFTEGRPGSVPMNFAMSDSCSDLDPSSSGIHPGPFDFTATVKHGVVLSVPSAVLLPLSGVLNVTASSPSGLPITDPSLAVFVQIQLSGDAWSTVGSATPSNGTATVPYSISGLLSGQTVKLRAVATGMAYTTGLSATRKVTLAAAPEVVICRTPRLRGLKLGPAKAALLKAHCSVGNIHKPRHIRRHHALRVSSQSPRAGTTHPEGQRVGITLR